MVGGAEKLGFGDCRSGFGEWIFIGLIGEFRFPFGRVEDGRGWRDCMIVVVVGLAVLRLIRIGTAVRGTQLEELDLFDDGCLVINHKRTMIWLICQSIHSILLAHCSC